MLSERQVNKFESDPPGAQLSVFKMNSEVYGLRGELQAPREPERSRNEAAGIGIEVSAHRKQE